MKFVWFFEFNPEDAEKVSERNRALDMDIEKDPELFPKLHPSHMMGLCKGFRIVEADSEELLIRLAIHLYPYENWEFQPIFEFAKVSQTWRKMKKLGFSRS
ncbi:MAG: hypothetical protein JSV27_07165 [Candidatus Bathyarchaeota archaeon]|nr:MAG: hypothetical protein JSV27_07165 [Candidatus Bathyarchaeota archaeon]